MIKVQYRFLRFIYRIIQRFAPNLLRRLGEIFLERTIYPLNEYFVDDLININRFSDLFDEVNRYSCNKKLEKNLDVVIMISVYNRFDLFSKCVHSVKSSLDSNVNQNLNVIIVAADDHSDELNREKIKNLCQEENITYIFHEKNLGVLQNINNIYEKFKCDFFVILNSDVIVQDNFINSLIEPLIQIQDVVLVTLPTFDMFNKTIPSGFNYKDLNKFLSWKDNYFILDSCTAVSYAMSVGCRKWKTVPLLDELYGKGYGEESDLHYRVISANFRSVWSFGSFVLHGGGGSFGQLEEVSVHKKWGRLQFFKRWSTKYLMDLPRLQFALEMFLKLSTRGFDLKIKDWRDSRYSNIKKNALVSSGFSTNIGGLQVALQALESDSFDYVYSMNFEHESKSENQLLLNGYTQALKSQIYDAKNILFVGHNSLVEFRDIIINNKENVEFYYVLQGFDNLIDSNSISIYHNILPKMKKIFVNSDEMKKLSKWFAPNVHTEFFKPKLDPIYYSGNFPEPNKREIDFLFLLRPEHGKGDFISLAVGNELSLKGYKVKYAGKSGKYRDDNNYLENASHTQIQQLTKNSKIFIDTFFYEGFGLTPREAILNGCKVFTGVYGPISRVEPKLKFPINFSYIPNYFDIPVVVDKLEHYLKEEKNSISKKDSIKLYETMFKFEKDYETIDSLIIKYL